MKYKKIVCKDTSNIWKYINSLICKSDKKHISGLSRMYAVMRAYKGGAKKRGYTWDLTEEQFKNITQKNCHYCGAKPNNISKTKCNTGDYIYNGIDRIDNNEGYTIDNVVPCCKTCNQAKSNKTLQEFKDWIKKVYIKMF